MTSSPKPPEEDSVPPDTPSTPAKRKVSQNNTPRHAAAVKRANAPSPKTPIRKTSGNVIKTPNTAPTRARTGSLKKPEPTLLGDFLLGRPSPARQRRKSLDAVKQELREANVGTIKVPGGVKDRVKQWQKTSSGAVIEDPNAISDENAANEREKEEGIEDGSVDEEERLRIKFRGAKRPGRRKSREEPNDEEGNEDKSRSKSAPRKRVISDDHWMTTRTPKKSPSKKKTGDQKIPKDFLAKTAVKEPLGQRVQDWIKISEGQDAEEKEVKPRSRKPSRQDLKPSKQEEPDDGIQVRPRSNSIDIGIRINDGIRIKPSEDTSKESLVDDGIRVKPVRKDDSKRRPKESEDDIKTPTRRSDKHLRLSSDFTSKSRASSHGSKKPDEEDDKFSFVTPSPPEKSKRKSRKSETPSELSEIPFGNSAFSVLDLPVGAEAGTMPRAPPKRTPSFGVPKVLKKVYNAVYDGPEPPRTGPNQPASIESWLNGTSDPFIDRPTPPQSVVDLPEAAPSRNASYKEDDRAERELTAEHESEHSGRRRRRVRKSLEKDEQESKLQDVSPLEIPKARETLPSIDHSSPISPTGLKRSPATRNASSPKTARKSLLKDAIFDAFKGESAMAGQTKTPSPFAEITGLRERDINRAPDFKPSREPTYDTEETSPKRSPRPLEKVGFDEPSNLREKSLPLYPRRPAPTTGAHRLSTIASVETFSSSSAAGTASELSQTTITQDTVLTQTTASGISRKSNNKPSKPGMKRRLTKHSDLISVLSLPDSAQPGRSKSIRSARSVRTTRSHLDTATVYDLMREVAEDEAKYMRELKTLVDGVIPVLLTCVLSKSDAAIAAGLFNPSSSSSTDAAFTKPIVDMGVALERLKSLHKRIPLDDADAFVTWALQAHRIYQDYLASWRSGFQDVVVNLAPASRAASAEEKSTLDELPRNANGDVVGANGERVDVAYLLKRPLVRVKYLTKAVKGLEKLKPSDTRTKAMEIWQDLEAYCRRRAKEEEARRVDQAANSTDPTRTRDPRTLAPMEDVKIDQTRQVYAKDYFSFDISHSNGQRIECRVEMLLRDKASDPADGDVLICEVNDIRRFLLFPPIAKDLISARIGNHKHQVVVMIRGIHGANEWRESFLLETEDEDAALEWVDMLGTVPEPPQLVRKDMDMSGVLFDVTPSNIDFKAVSSSPTVDGDIPIGERRRREAEETVVRRERQRSSRHSRAASTLPESIKEESTISEPGVTDLNDAMSKAGSPLGPIKRARAARYHSRTKSSPPTTFVAEMSGALDPYPDEASASSELVKDVDNRAGSPEPNEHTMSLPFIPKRRQHSAPATPDKAKLSTPLKEATRPDPDVMTRHQPATPDQDDGAPLPPPHRTLTPTGLKNTPVLDTPTPRAKARRSSSPLKHEYQPSDASGTSSSSEESDSQSDSSDSYTESSDEDELEAADIPSALPSLHVYGNKRVSPNGSMYSIPNTSLAPSNSASQGPYRGVPAQRSPAVTRKNTATISGWSDGKGRWIDLHPEPCSIVVTPGLIEVFELNAAHSSPSRDETSDANQSNETLVQQPLLGQVLTPVIPLRQSTAVDIEIQSPATGESRLSTKNYRTIRYRTINNYDCVNLYSSVHRARLENPVFKKLEEERRVNGFGGNDFNSGRHERRRSWVFGRKKSYRASTRAPSEVAESEQSGKSHSSAFSALRRMTGSSMFNIAKSSIDTSTNRGSAATSTYTSNLSDWSGPTPPRTPTSPSLMGSSYSNGVVKNLGSENLKIRLYLLESGGKWNDLGAARLTVTQPPPGMRQASSLYHGIERRIIVTRKPTTHNLNPFSGSGDKIPTKAEEESDNLVLLDVILGAECFSKIGRTGIAANVWEDIVGPNGEVGMVGAVGGVSGRTRKWLFQTGCAGDASWIFGLVAVGR